MMSSDLTQFRRLERDLKATAAKAFPYASNAMINRGVTTARDIARDTVGAKMIERNTWTRRSIQVRYSRTLVVSAQEAAVGSTEDYMATQEFGGVKRGKGSARVAVPMPEASGEGALPRRKLVRAAMTMKRITLGKRVGSSDRRARNAAAVNMAASSKGRSKFVFLDLGRRSGIFRVTGGKRNPKLTKIHSLGQREIIIPKRVWLRPAVLKAASYLPRYGVDALTDQLQRRGLFKG